MSESAQHQQLVNQLISEATKIVGLDNRCFILSDAVNGFALPPLQRMGTGQMSSTNIKIC